MKYGGGITPRLRDVPVVVFQDANTGAPRCINGLHVQTFIQNPSKGRNGTLITFASGDKVTVTADFKVVFDTLIGIVDG
ncbi:MAG TPA: hypothetical protein VJZ76_12835 [Thermoanaerobaculia bacterium]|nr:hypothetical protein [Thermoanaerobaculia bacterium]